MVFVDDSLSNAQLIALILDGGSMLENHYFCVLVCKIFLVQL